MEQKSIEAFLEKAKPGKKTGTKTRDTPSPGRGEKRDLSHLEGALRMYREIGHQEGIADTLVEIALHHAGNDLTVRAIEAADRSLEAARELQDYREAISLMLLGDLRYRARDRSLARDLWQQAAEHSEAEPSQIIGAFLRLAWADIEAGDAGFGTWLERATSLGDTPQALLMGSAHARRSGDHRVAVELIERAIALGPDPGVSPISFPSVPILPSVEVPDLYRLLGTVLTEAGKTSEAAAAYHRAGDHLAEGDAYRELGNTERALSAYEAGKKRTSESIYTVRIAEILIEAGDHGRALSLLERSEKDLLAREPAVALEALDLRLLITSGGHGHKHGDGDGIGDRDKAGGGDGIGDRDKARGGDSDRDATADASAGMKRYRTGLLEKKGDIYERLEEFGGMTESLLKAASLYREMGDEESWLHSVEAVRRVIALESRRGRVEEELRLRGDLERYHVERGKPVGALYAENVERCYSLGKPMLAVAFFRRGIELHGGDEETFPDHLHLARSFLSGGKLVEAGATYQEASRRLSDPGKKGMIFRELGYLYRITGEVKQAAKTLETALSLAQRGGDREGEIRVLCELEKLADDEVEREKMVRSAHINEMAKVIALRDKLTEENNASQKIIRETGKIIEAQEAERAEKHSLIDSIREGLPEAGPDRTRQLAVMEKLRTAVDRMDTSIENLNRTIRDNQSRKLSGQEERTRLASRLTELMKEDAVMKRKIEGIEATAAGFRERALKLDPMLATSAKLDTLEEDIYRHLATGSVPQITIPTRTKENIEFSDEKRVFRYGSGLSSRSAKSTDGANMLMRTAYVIDFIDDMIRTSLAGKNRSSTLRELYYISESWGKLSKFGTQNESNNLIEDLEIISSHLRENFHLRPEEDGARVIGNITLRERNRKGEWKDINCRNDVGDSGYTIPYNVEKEKLLFTQVDADLVIAIETGGMFDRLVENGFDEEARAVLVHIKGQPARSTRRFLKRLNEETRLPVLVFTDGDPWSYRIYASIAYGAIKTAHLSHHLATPSAEFIGITPSDILSYDLPTDRLSDKDLEALNSELTDPRFADEFWQNEISTQLKIKKKSEQQALAKYGLDFVTETYLPEKLREMGYMG